MIEILMYTCITRMFTCKGCIDCSYASQVCYSLFLKVIPNRLHQCSSAQNKGILYCCFLGVAGEYMVGCRDHDTNLQFCCPQGDFYNNILSYFLKNYFRLIWNCLTSI